MRTVDIQDEHTLSNGAVVQRRSNDCEVCVNKGQAPDPSIFGVEYDGQVVEVCDAHMQQILDADADKQMKGGLFEEIFGNAT